MVSRSRPRQVAAPMLFPEVVLQEGSTYSKYIRYPMSYRVVLQGLCSNKPLFGKEFGSKPLFLPFPFFILHADHLRLSNTPPIAKKLYNPRQAPLPTAAVDHPILEKYEEVTGTIAEMEKRVVMAESMLEATIQCQSGRVKAQPSPRYVQQDSSPVWSSQEPTQDLPMRMI